MSRAEIAAKKAELAAKDDEVCRGYGARPGTDVYIKCRMAQQKARDDADNAAAMSQPARIPTATNGIGRRTAYVWPRVGAEARPLFEHAQIGTG